MTETSRSGGGLSVKLFLRGRGTYGEGHLLPNPKPSSKHRDLQLQQQWGGCLGCNWHAVWMFFGCWILEDSLRAVWVPEPRLIIREARGADGCFWVMDPSSLWGRPGAAEVLRECLVPDFARDSAGAAFGVGSRNVFVGSIPEIF